MKTIVMVVAFLMCFAGSSNADVLDFEDPVIDKSGQTTIGGGTFQDVYDGFVFEGSWVWVSQDYQNREWWTDCIIDEHNIVNGYTNWGAINSISRVDGDAFIWDGAFFSSGRDYNYDQEIILRGYLNGVEVEATPFVPEYSTNNSWFDAGWEIDTLTIEQLSGANCSYTIDNFTFNENTNPAPVPEPCTMLLFGTGMAGMAAIRRFKK